MRALILGFVLLALPLYAADVSRDIHAAYGGFSVTTSDSTVYAPPSRAIYVGGAGNLKVRMAGTGETITFTAVAVGTLLPIAVDMVYATDTTATAILFLR